MLIKITSKRQVTFPARVLDAMGVGPGDRLELQEGSRRVPAAPKTHRLLAPGHPARQDTGRTILRSISRTFREKPYDPALRD